MTVIKLPTEKTFLILLVPQKIIIINKVLVKEIVSKLRDSVEFPRNRIETMSLSLRVSKRFLRKSYRNYAYRNDFQGNRIETMSLNRLSFGVSKRFL